MFPKHLVVKQEIHRVEIGDRRSEIGGLWTPAFRVYADRPSGNLVAPMRLAHYPHPFAWNEHLTNGNRFKKIRFIGGVGKDGRTEKNRVLPLNLVEDMRFSNDARKLIGIRLDVAVIINSKIGRASCRERG